MQSPSRKFPTWGIVSLAILGAVAVLPRQAAAPDANPTGTAASPIPAEVWASRTAGRDAHGTATAAQLAPAATPSPPLAEAVPQARPQTPIAFSTPPQAVAIRLAPREVRAQMKYETVRFAGRRVRTLDEPSRILLTQAAAANAGLHRVGLGFADVYGVIEAETSWIPRTGMGKNGVRSIGLAQFEPGTAKGLGLKNPNDPVEAVFAAAVNLRHGANWAARKIDHLELPPARRAAKLREGVSIYYNLSVKGRNQWNGLNTAKLPIETRRHIRNVRSGAREALQLARELGA